MDRREALRLLATGAALQFTPGNLLSTLRHARLLLEAQARLRTLNTHQQAIVRTMAEMILPRTETPGAADVGAVEFIDLMLTEWYDEPDRAQFLSGLADVDDRSHSLFGADFVACPSIQQVEILRVLGERMLEQADAPLEHARSSRGPRLNPHKNFYSMLRGLTLTAYYTSEQGATAELNFQIIPERYDGCAHLGSGERGPENK